MDIRADKVQAATIRRSESRQRWSEANTELKRAQAIVYAREAEYCAMDAFVESAKATTDKHPLFRIIRYYAEQSQRHANKSMDCAKSNNPAGAEGLLYDAKYSYSMAQRLADFTGKVSVIDGIAVWQESRKTIVAQYLDHPEYRARLESRDIKQAVKAAKEKAGEGK